jgi:hypothetical protein
VLLGSRFQLRLEALPQFRASHDDDRRLFEFGVFLPRSVTGRLLRAFRDNPRMLGASVPKHSTD